MNVDGLTLKAAAGNCGTAILAVFDQESFTGRDGNSYRAGNFRTATIQNVHIVGSSPDGYGEGHWGHGGIYLETAAHSVIDRVTIDGGRDRTPNGIVWQTPKLPPYFVCALQATNLTIKWCNTALRTAGRVEAVYVRGFNFASCGRQGAYAVHLDTTSGGLASFINGRVESVGGGVRISKFSFNKLSNVDFFHGSGGAVENGTMLFVEQNRGGTTYDTSMSYDTTVSGCLFNGASALGVAEQNGVFLSNTRMVRLAGNRFEDMRPANGSSIVVLGNCNTVRIVDNQLRNVRNAFHNDAYDTHFRNNSIF